jgi:transcriptional regulator with XRE-family HTH domain
MPPTVNNPGQIGAVLRRLRQERGITQEALAFKAHVTIATLSRVERCVTTPAWTTAQAISGALGLTLQDLARAVEDEPAHLSPAPGGDE